MLSWTLTGLEWRGKRRMICSRACGVVQEVRARVRPVGGRSLRSRLVLLRLRDGNVEARRRRLDLRSRGGRLRLRVRGLRRGGARPGVREGGVFEQDEKVRMEMEWAYAFAGDNAESFAVYCVASSEDLVEHARQCDLLVARSAQVEESRESKKGEVKFRFGEGQSVIGKRVHVDVRTGQVHIPSMPSARVRRGQ